MSDYTKGDKIRIIKGKYVGCEAWKDGKKKRKKGSRSRPVIVRLADGSEKRTNIYTNSYKMLHGHPSCYEEAAMQQHTDMELALMRFAEMWISCRMTAESDEFALEFLKLELNEARSKFKDLGSKARYRLVEFDEEAMGVASGEL